MPIGFVHFLAQSETLQQVLDTVAEWINRIFNSDRASITLYENNDHLKVYSFSGSKAIPAEFLVPFIKRLLASVQKATTDDLRRCYAI